jgi:hypothetical protein
MKGKHMMKGGKMMSDKDMKSKMGKAPMKKRAGKARGKSK